MRFQCGRVAGKIPAISAESFVEGLTGCFDGLRPDLLMRPQRHHPVSEPPALHNDRHTSILRSAVPLIPDHPRRSTA